MRYDNIVESIGRTPLIRINSVANEQRATIWGKRESANPMFSVKDRIAKFMIREAEKTGKIKPGITTIVEPTSGNTGIGLAMVCVAKGYKLIIVMPDTMTAERRKILTALGAELVLTPGTSGMKGAMAEAETIVTSNKNNFLLHQFRNLANKKAHRETTVLEIVEDMEDLSIDAFVAGVGTGGTISGVGEVLKEHGYETRIIAVEPADSPVLSGGEAGSHKIQGIGAGFIPEILNRSVIDEIKTVKNEEAFAMARQLAKKDGIFVGISAGANVAAATRVADDLGPEKHVVTILCDTGERYLSTDLFS